MPGILGSVRPRAAISDTILSGLRSCGSPTPRGAWGRPRGCCATGRGRACSRRPRSPRAGTARTTTRTSPLPPGRRRVEQRYGVSPQALAFALRAVVRPGRDGRRAAARGAHRPDHAGDPGARLRPAQGRAPARRPLTMDSVEIQVRTGDRLVTDLTEAVADFCRGRGDGLLSVFVPHATAGLALVETGSGTEDDLQDLVDRVLPPDDRYRHRHGTPRPRPRPRPAGAGVALADRARRGRTTDAGHLAEPGARRQQRGQRRAARAAQLPRRLSLLQHRHGSVTRPSPSPWHGDGEGAPVEDRRRVRVLRHPVHETASLDAQDSEGQASASARLRRQGAGDVGGVNHRTVVTAPLIDRLDRCQDPCTCDRHRPLSPTRCGERRGGRVWADRARWRHECCTRSPQPRGAPTVGIAGRPAVEHVSVGRTGLVRGSGRHRPRQGAGRRLDQPHEPGLLEPVVPPTPAARQLRCRPASRRPGP